MSSSWMNRLYFGDNLKILREQVEHETVDLVYLDPPFNSAASYNVLFADKSGAQSAAQITAFEDTWHWGPEASGAYHELVTDAPERVARLIQALHGFLGQSDMMAYLVMMAPRLQELHRVLKPTGSIYLHCDPTASHYLRMLMDAIFRPENFRNEIVWKRTTAHSDSKRWSACADVLLYYGKTGRVIWNAPSMQYAEGYTDSKYPHTDETKRRFGLWDMGSPNPRPNLMYDWLGFPHPPKGWRYQRDTMQQLHDANRIWYPTHRDGTYDHARRPRLKRYLDERDGQIVASIWTDIPPLNSQARERLGYPTQKPEALLERILNASSREGDVVLDPFCGCGTTVSVAERLNRKWIGIDVTHLAITLIQRRLEDAFGTALRPHQVLGAPTDLAGAENLAARDRYQFQWWALDRIEARPAGDQRKKGADSGIDGRIVFFDDASGTAKHIIVSVKSGGVSVNDVRDLNGVLTREAAPIGVLISLQTPTRPMVLEALSAGYYEPAHFPGRRFPKIQLLTVEDILRGKRPEFVQLGRDTFRQAPKSQTTDQVEMVI